MPDTGFLFPGTAVGNRGAGGGDPWTNVNDVMADDGNTADTTIEIEESLGLAATNFDFSGIPAGSSIDGIEIRIGDYVVQSVADGPLWDQVRLILADDSDGSENKNGEIANPTTSNNTDEAGGAADLWTESIELVDVQDSDFGFFVTADITAMVVGTNLEVDFMQMKIYYTGPPPQEAWAMNTQRNSRKTKH